LSPTESYSNIGEVKYNLAPNLVKAAVEGRLPRGVGVERLRDPPTEWGRQFDALGLNPE
jgi:site-specific DNA recombinase